MIFDFSDVPDYAWYVDYVYTGVQIGLIKDNFGFIFPDEEITRGEFAFMASGVLNIQDCRLKDSDGDGMPDWWEMEHEGLDPFFAGDAGLDFDFDSRAAARIPDTSGQNVGDRGCHRSISPDSAPAISSG